MKRILAAALAALATFAAQAATLSPVSLINPAGSTSGQVIVSNGPSTAPSWSSAFGPFTFTSSGQFYQNLGAKVNRINDRLFVGAATLNNGTNVASQPDWLTQLFLAKGRTYGYIQTSQMAVLNGTASQDSLTTAVFGAQNSGRAAGQVIGVTGIGVNNSAVTGTGQAWGAYFEGYRDTAGHGGAYGFEADTMNYANLAQGDPYSQNTNQSVTGQLACGGGYLPTGQFPCTAAVNIQNNGAAYDKGIIFGSNSISGADGTNGTGTAIALGKGHTLQWYGAASTPTSSILSTGTTTAAGIQQLFTDNTVTLNNASGKAVFKALGVSSGVNGVQALGASTGNAVALQAIGDDTNIPLQVSGKGTSGVSIKGTTAGDLAAAGMAGETISATFSAVNMTTSGTVQSLGSIVLTAGDWDVTGYVMYTTGTGATLSIWIGGLNTVNNALPAIGNYFQSTGTIGPAAGASAVAPISRQNVTTNTTVYFIGEAVFSGGAVTATGFLRARRMR
jgi:hypothetical protein